MHIYIYDTPSSSMQNAKAKAENTFAHSFLRQFEYAI